MNFWEYFALAVIATLSSLIGARITQNNFKEGLESERIKRKEDREYTAKKAAFEEAGENVLNFLTYVLTLPDKELPTDGNIAPEVNELSRAMNKLHFYASLPTLEKTTALAQKLVDAFHATLKAKLPAMKSKSDFLAADQEIEGLSKMNNSIQSELNAILQSQPDSLIVIEQRKELAKNFSRIRDLHGKKQSLNLERYAETEKCRDVLLSVLNDIYGSMRDFLVAARGELGFQLDEQKYVELVNMRAKEALDSTRSTIESVRTSFDIPTIAEDVSAADEEQYKIFGCGPRCLQKLAELQGLPISASQIIREFKQKYPIWEARCGLSPTSVLCDIAVFFRLCVFADTRVDRQLVKQKLNDGVTRGVILCTDRIINNDGETSVLYHYRLVLSWQPEGLIVWTPFQDGRDGSMLIKDEELDAQLAHFVIFY